MNISLQYTSKSSRFYIYSTLFENLNFGSLVYFLYFEQFNDMTTLFSLSKLSFLERLDAPLILNYTF